MDTSAAVDSMKNAPTPQPYNHELRVAIELAREAGADEVIVFTQRDFETEVKRLTDGKGVEVVYDSVGKTTFAGSLDSLALRGMMPPQLHIGVRPVGELRQLIERGAVRGQGRGFDPDPTVAQGIYDCLGAIVHFELPQDRADVIFDRLIADAQLATDDLVAIAAGDQVQDLDLTR